MFNVLIIIFFPIATNKTSFKLLNVMYSRQYRQIKLNKILNFF